MTPHRTPYEIIGVEPSCTQTQLKRAFRRKAKELHPDRNKDKHATKMMVVLLAAWEQIKTPERRQVLDDALAVAESVRRAAERRQEDEARAEEARRRAQKAKKKKKKKKKKAAQARTTTTLSSSVTHSQYSTATDSRGSYSSVMVANGCTVRTRSASPSERADAKLAADSRTHRGDLHVDRRRKLRFAGTVTGSVHVDEGCVLEITGAILGDLLLDGGSVTLLGTLKGAVRATSGSVDIVGETSGTFFGGTNALR